MKYEHILAPVQVGGKVLKSRLLSPKCLSGGDTTYAGSRKFYCNMARKGAATVTMGIGTWPDCEGKRSGMSHQHMDDPTVRADYARLLDDIHKYDTLCSATLMTIEPQYCAISDTPNWNSIPMVGDYSRNFSNKPGISYDRLQGMIDDFAFQCKELKKIGFDMATIYMSNRASILACSLSPLLNQRTDKYGGSTMKERATLALEVFGRIKDACGKDFLIECQVSGEEEAPGYTVEEWLDFCELASKDVDIFQVRSWEGSLIHINGYCYDEGKQPTIKYAEAFKKRGIPSLVAPISGFGDLDNIERLIADGKTDLVSMGRAFMADEDFGVKLREGRGKDITPCLMCMGCGMHCRVNPEADLKGEPGEPRKQPEKHKNVAIVGGGPAGMRAALLAAEQGHRVTLFEKTDELGGQLKHAKYPKFKWPLNHYLLWMKDQIAKTDVQVKLNTEVTPDTLSGYDAILLAMGSKPTKIPVPMDDDVLSWTVDAVYGRENELGKNVLVVGGGESGCETALYLAEAGHTVTLIGRGEIKLYENSHCKYMHSQRYLTNPNLNIIEFCTTKAIHKDYVECDVIKGYEKRDSMEFGGGHKGDVGGYLGENDEDSQERLMRLAKEMGHTPNESIPGGPGGMPGPGGISPFELLGNREPAVNISTMNGHKAVDIEIPERKSQEMSETVIDMTDSHTEAWRLSFDDIVISGGRTALLDQVDGFRAIAPEVYVIGDNLKPGDLHYCLHAAYEAVMAL